MSDTVKYSDEKKLLTSDEFIAAAKANADKNLQIQKDTAQKVYDSTYASLDRQYNEAAAAAGVAKERNLIDADTAYQRQEMKYGAEQEALAAAGLSGSGMNEYRRAQSYQKNREDRQMSYAEYDRALREANYARDQGKLAADLNKAQSDAAAEMHYNDTMTSISEKELGYADLERQEIDTAYGGYLAGIEDGSLTLDQIKADSSWEKLSPGQQASVEKTAKIKGIKTKIDNGESWEDIQKSYAYLELDEDGRNQIDGYHAQVEAGKTKDANAASGNYLEMATKGMSIDGIVAVATANGHYQALVDSGFWNAVTAEAESYANKQAEADVDANYNTALGLLADGWTLEEIKKHLGTDAVKALTDSGKLAQLENASNVMARIKSETEGKAAQEKLLTYLDYAASGKYTLDELKAIAQSLGHYDVLNNAGYWAQVEGKITNNETRTNIEDAIANGATLEDVEKMDGWNELSETEQNAYKGAIEDRDEEKEVSIDSFVANLFVPGNEVYSLDDLDTVMRAEGVPSEMREEIRSRWQGEMANRTIASINDGSAINGENALTGAALAENIKNGVYGDQGEQVATEFIAFMLSALQDSDADINDATDVHNLISGLKDYVSDDLWTKISVALGYKDTWWRYSEDAVFEGVPVKLGNEIIDSRTLSSLERYKSKHTKNQVITFNGNMYYRDGDKWWALEKDTSRPTGLITVDWISNSEYKLETGIKWSYNGDKKIALKDSESDALNNMFPDSTTGNVATINGIRYGKDGYGKWWRIK